MRRGAVGGEGGSGRGSARGADGALGGRAVVPLAGEVGVPVVGVDGRTAAEALRQALDAAAVPVRRRVVVAVVAIAAAGSGSVDLYHTYCFSTNSIYLVSLFCYLQAVLTI